MQAPVFASKSCRDRRCLGISLIEITGALAVMVILGGLVLTNVIQRITLAQREAERVGNSNLAEALRSHIARSKSIPGTASWAPAVADQLALAVNQVLTNRLGNHRFLAFDPAFRVGLAPTSTLPYLQSAVGSVAIANPRVLLVSSTGPALPAIAVSTNSFAALWNTPPGTIPAALTNAWRGNPADLHVLRLDLRSLFKRVMLENLDLGMAAPFSVEGLSPITNVAAGHRRELWLIDSTAIDLHFGAGGLQAREFVGEDTSYTFENGIWRRYLRYGRSGSVGWFGDMVDRFLAAPPPPGTTRRYSNQQWIVDTMYVFLYNFGQWSLDDFDGGEPWPHIPGYELSAAGAAGLKNFTSDLIHFY